MNNITFNKPLQERCKADSVHKIIFTIFPICSMLNSIITYRYFSRHSKLLFFATFFAFLGTFTYIKLGAFSYKKPVSHKENNL